MRTQGPIVVMLALVFATSTNAQDTALPIPCLMKAHRTIKLASAVPGVLDKVFVDRGDRVTQDMLVAKLQTAVEEADVASAAVKATDESGIQEKQARKAFTQAKLGRLEQLRGTSQFVARGAVEEAAADAQQAEAQLLGASTALKLNRIELIQAQAKLKQREIRSPVNGVVTERSLSAGEYAFDQASVLTVAELDPLNIEAFLPISLYGSVKMGARMLVRPEQPIGGSYAATVVIIDQVVDSRSGTFGVRLQLPNPDGVLPAGFRCHLVDSPPG